MFAVVILGGFIQNYRENNIVQTFCVWGPNQGLSYLIKPDGLFESLFVAVFSEYLSPMHSCRQMMGCMSLRRQTDQRI